MSAGRKPLSIQTLLALLVACLLAPILIFSAVLLSRYAAGERARQQSDALEIARQLAGEVDRELSGLQGALQVMTTYISFDLRDWAVVHRQAEEVKGFLGAEIVYKDASGQQFVNTRLPFGTPLPNSLPSADQRALSEKKPVISDLFTGATARRPILSLNAPVIRGGEAVGLVNLALEPERLSSILRSRLLPEGWVAALVDGNGTLVARSRGAEQYVGQTATSDLLANATGQEGTWSGTTKEGTTVLSAYARSSVSGWRVSVGAPATALNSPQSFWWLLAGGVAALAFGTLTGGWCGRQIAKSLRSVADQASSLSSAGVVTPLQTRLAEVNAVSNALSQASRNLVTETAHRSNAEANLRAETDRLDALNRVGQMIASELDQQSLVQKITDAGVGLCGAAFGAFFYNVHHEGETLTLYTISGAPREAFSKFPMPRGTRVFAPTLTGVEVVRSDDITRDSRYGHNAPHKGMPAGHLPVRSYLAVPVVSRSGDVLGALFFGHPDPKVFTDRHEELLVGVAAQAAVGLDNARLFKSARAAEAEVRRFNEDLEDQVADRTKALQSANQQLIAEVAQREKVEEQLRQAQKIEAVGQLTGGIAHDFNNLLAVISGSLQLMQRRLDRGETGAVQRYLASAMDGADRAATLTNRLLAFARQQPLAPEPVPANKLIAGTSELLRRTLGEQFEFETVLAGGLWLTHADPHQLENAIINLAVNARDAMQEGGKLTIETANCHLDERYARDNPGIAPGQFVMIAVTDNGAGMAPEVMSRAFEPFYTTKSVGKGTGLGLSQVYGFVRQSGGHVKIYSELGSGTSVKIYLPRFFGAVGDAHVTPESKTMPTSGGKETVLLVEDEASVRSMSVAAVRELGYEVLEADSAGAALRIIDSGARIDLLFTDVVMPDMNGRKLADEATRRRPDLKVLFTTGYTRNAIVHNGMLDAHVHLVAKPYTLEQLAFKIRSALEP